MLFIGGVFGRDFLVGCGFLFGRRFGFVIGGMIFCLFRIVFRGFIEIKNMDLE